jgi:hypothetical protein
MIPSRKSVEDAQHRPVGVPVGSSSVGWPDWINQGPQKGIEMSEDPWKHRSKGMQCRTCMWYVEKAPAIETGDLVTAPKPGFGRCRRHAPTMNGYPAVFSTDWCGDHKVDENKI